jgi:putative membrane protein
MMMWPSMMSGFFGGWGITGMILMFVFWALIITGIILLIVWAVKRANYPAEDFKVKGKSALDILKERYAKGEITKKEFETMKKDIS